MATLTLDEMLGLGTHPAPMKPINFETPGMVQQAAEDAEADPYAGLYPPGLMPPPMAPPPPVAPDAEATPPGGMLPAYATASRPAMPSPISLGDAPFSQFADTWMKGAPQDAAAGDASTDLLAEMLDGQRGSLQSASKEPKALPGYSFMKPTAAQMKGDSFLLPMSRSETRLAETGYRRPAERSQWLRSLRVKKGFY